MQTIILLAIATKPSIFREIAEGSFSRRLDTKRNITQYIYRLLIKPTPAMITDRARYRNANVQDDDKGRRVSDIFADSSRKSGEGLVVYLI